MLISNVVEPDSWNLDPDPEYVIHIRIQAQFIKKLENFKGVKKATFWIEKCFIAFFFLDLQTSKKDLQAFYDWVQLGDDLPVDNTGLEQFGNDLLIIFGLMQFGDVLLIIFGLMQFGDVLLIIFGLVHFGSDLLIIYG
jgi:hypothetical protein